MSSEFSALCNLIGLGFAFAIGFRGFDACFRLFVSFLQRRKDRRKNM